MGMLDDMTIVEGAVGVSRRFRDLVEQFEPGVHAFAPLILEYKDGARLNEEYFLFSTQQDIDCLITANDPKSFRYLWTDAETGEKRILCRLTEPGRDIPISVPAVEGRHLWTAGLLGRTQMFVSDVFFAMLRKTIRGYLSSRNASPSTARGRPRNRWVHCCPDTGPM